MKKEKLFHRAEFADEMEQVSLMHEMTGMIPVPPQNEEEAAAYEEMTARHVDFPSKQHDKVPKK